jgi:hypothetical protein
MPELSKSVEIFGGLEDVNVRAHLVPLSQFTGVVG